MSKLLKTILSRKDVGVLIWIMVSNAIMAGLSYITTNPDLYDPKWVGLANILLVSVLKKEIKK